MSGSGVDLLGDGRDQRDSKAVITSQYIPDTKILLGSVHTNMKIHTHEKSVAEYVPFSSQVTQLI